MNIRACCFQHQRSACGLRVIALMSAFLFIACTAKAVENIRRVVWNPTTVLAWSPRVSTTSVVFDADLTPLELAYAVTSFSIAVLPSAGNPSLLARYSCGPLPVGLPAGTSARFQIEFSMACDPFMESVDITLGNATISYLYPSRGELSSRLSVERAGAVASARETFGLAILDMNGVMHPLVLPSDTFACPASPEDGSIGVYFDPQGNSCQGTIPAGTVGKVYVLAKLAGGTAGGIAGAQFRFSGPPAAWEVYAVPNPAIVAIGDPFVEGVVAGFVCQPPVGGVVLLYTVLVVAHETIQDVRFEIGGRVPTINEPCPMLLACDEPVFTKFCVDGISCYVNATTVTPCMGGVAVNQATWSSVKALFR